MTLHIIYNYFGFAGSVDSADSADSADSDPYSDSSCECTSYAFCVTASVVFPVFQDLSFALNMMLTRSAAIIAIVIPPAVALRPPKKIPITPSALIASLTPVANA